MILCKFSISIQQSNRITRIYDTCSLLHITVWNWQKHTNLIITSKQSKLRDSRAAFSIPPVIPRLRSGKWCLMQGSWYALKDMSSLTNPHSIVVKSHIDGFSIANALDILQACTKPSIFRWHKSYDFVNQRKHGRKWTTVCPGMYL